MRVIVGLSGGVDSSVATLLLRQAGYDVTGITMRIWRKGKYEGGQQDACFSPAEESDVTESKALCEKLGIPYHTFECGDTYEELILQYFRDEYLAGRTPNPCVRCNDMMKFGLLPDLAKAAGLEFDRFATGHYARVDQHNGRYRLLRGRDKAKDQSYFLYRLGQSKLERHIFPLGDMTKEEVRDIARENGLDMAEKPDSQDFYSGDYNEIIGAEDRPGDIVMEDGKVLGKHSGFWKFTIGQRKGLGISYPFPLYVVAVDPVHNQVIVGTADRGVSYSLIADTCNWVSVAAPTKAVEVAIKVRSAGEPKGGAIVYPEENGMHRVEYPEGMGGVAPGQSVVFYQEDVILGGGIIREAR